MCFKEGHLILQSTLWMTPQLDGNGLIRVAVFLWRCYSDCFMGRWHPTTVCAEMVATANFEFRRREGFFFFILQTRPGFAQVLEEASCQE